MMGPYWNILIVDDEPDVHEVVRLVFKHLTWRGFGFRLASAYSAAEAKHLLMRHGDMFHVALVDGVMETLSSGLELCHHMRRRPDLSVRTILHTAVYSESYARKNCGDIFDAILPKAEVTAVRLHRTICACLDERTADLARRMVA